MIFVRFRVDWSELNDLPEIACTFLPEMFSFRFHVVGISLRLSGFRCSHVLVGTRIGDFAVRFAPVLVRLLCVWFKCSAILLTLVCALPARSSVVSVSL